MNTHHHTPSSNADRTASECASAGAHLPIDGLTQSDLDRFWVKVDTSGECWEWTSTIQSSGYGMFRVRAKYLYAHRIAWVMNNGVIPDGLLVCHRCDNPKCVRVDHLFLGTVRDNTLDAYKKGRVVVPHEAHLRALRDNPEKFVQGERNPNAKLTDEKVRYIREKFALGAVSPDSLAIEVGVTPGTLRNVITRRSWRHVN